VDIALITSDKLSAQQIRKESAIHQKEQQAKQLEHQNRSRRDNTFAVNDLVLRKVMSKAADGSKHALDTKYVGPFRVKEVTNTSCVICQVGANFSGTSEVHPDHLKPFHPVNEPLDSLRSPRLQF
jgi:hypothetical protein